MVVDAGDDKRTWRVQFGDDIEQITALHLKIVKDTRLLFKWTTVQDSIPDHSVIPASMVGVVGFNFTEAFADVNAAIETPEY